MVAELALPDLSAAPSPARLVDGWHPIDHLTGPAPLLFALNYATALPPDALQPRSMGCPEVHPGLIAIANPVELAAILERPSRHVGCGQVRLGDVDARLAGLVIALEAFHVGAGSGVLVAIGVISPEGTGRGGAGIADLWRLARKEAIRHRLACTQPGRLGEDALLAIYGRTAQVAWLTRRRVMTVSVTRLDSDRGWLVEAARSIATLAHARVDDHLDGHVHRHAHGAAQSTSDRPRPA